MDRILVVFAHPALEKSRVNKRLIEAVRATENATLHDLYESYPYFDIDVTREQKLLVEHDVIVFQHPFYWYSVPALLKEWMDLVLTHGFAYGQSGTSLRGKRLFNAVTTGGSAHAYSAEGKCAHTITQLLAPIHQTANLCGMRFLPPFVVHDTHLLKDAADFQSYVDNYGRVLNGLVNGEIHERMLNDVVYLNDCVKALGS